MRYFKLILIPCILTALSLPALAQNQKPAEDAAAKPADKKPSDADMMAMMMALAKTGENHKLLQEGTGTWSYTSNGG